MESAGAGLCDRDFFCTRRRLETIAATSPTISPGFSVLFYIARWDAVRVYLRPRYIYSRAHNENSSPIDSNESTASSHPVSGSFGAILYF